MICALAIGWAAAMVLNLLVWPPPRSPKVLVKEMYDRHTEVLAARAAERKDNEHYSD